MAGLVLILFALVEKTQRIMKSILSQVPVLFFCILCNNLYLTASSHTGCEYVMVAGNNDSLYESFSKPNVFMDDPPDVQMFSSGQVRIFCPGRRFVTCIHLPDFNTITKQHYFPDRAIPPPIC
jgi:hypothetical protein